MYSGRGKVGSYGGLEQQSPTGVHWWFRWSPNRKSGGEVNYGPTTNLQWCNSEESKTIFCQLSVNWVLSVYHRGMHHATRRCMAQFRFSKVCNHCDGSSTVTFIYYLIIMFCNKSTYHYRGSRKSGVKFGGQAPQVNFFVFSAATVTGPGGEICRAEILSWGDPFVHKN